MTDQAFAAGLRTCTRAMLSEFCDAIGTHTRSFELEAWADILSDQLLAELLPLLHRIEALEQRVRWIDQVEDEIRALDARLLALEGRQ